MTQKKKKTVQRIRTKTLVCRVIVPLVIILAVGALAILALLGKLPLPDAADRLDSYFSMARMRTETVVILLILAVLLPLTLVSLALAVLRQRKTNPTDEPAILVPKNFMAQETEASPVEEKKTKPGQVIKAAAGPRFATLTEIDRQAARPVEPAAEPAYNDTMDLMRFCEGFRLFAASRRRLYYEPSDVRAFVASLGVSPILIMQGISGTGKTSMATAFGEYIGRSSAVVPIQPMWKERSDMIGYFNEFTERFNETPLLCTLYEAQYSRDLFITVLDEMNIARVEYYFADFLSLLELPDKNSRRLDVVSDTRPGDPKRLSQGKLLIPDNMWFIGTANNDDSTFAISDKVYDRAMIINLDRKAKPFTAPLTDPVHLSIDHWRVMCREALERYAMSDQLRAGLARFDAYIIEHFHITFGNRITKQIEQFIPLYVACGGTETEALDGLLLTKLLRKLELQNPIYIRNEAEGLMNCLNEVFGTEVMPACRAYIRQLQIGR